eukprot:gene32677-17692_t
MQQANRGSASLPAGPPKGHQQVGGHAPCRPVELSSTARSMHRE